MANPRYNTQVTQPRGNQTRVGKMGGGMMMQRPMYKAGGRTKKMSEAQKQAAKKTGAKVKKIAKMALPGAGLASAVKKFRESKKAGGRIAGAARRAQQHGYYTPDMGMKGGKMYAKGGKVSGKKRIIAAGRGKAKDYPGIKKIIEMNKKGKKRFKDGGSALKPVDKSKNPGLAKLPTQVRNKMGYMKKGGRVHKNTRRMNRLEELGRVDAEKARTRKGKRNLRDEKKRIVKELKK
jgi:hypothetical protein